MYGPGHDYQLPLPATFVLARGTGRIGYAFVDQVSGGFFVSLISIGWRHGAQSTG